MSGTGAEGFDPPNDNVEAPPTRGRSYLAGGVAAAFVALALGYAFWPATTSVPPPTTTTTASTTTTIARLPSGTFEVATVKAELERVMVRAEEPEDWATARPALIMEAPDPPPASQAVMPPRVPLPTPDAPIAGRYAVDGGWEFANPGPYEPRQPFTMLVTERRGDWAKVMLPLRPNGTQGWVRATDVEFSTTTNRIEISVGERQLRAYDDTELVVEAPVVVGTAFTQTPTGWFYVTDIVPQQSPSFGPVALALNAYSEMIDEFDDGVPVVALHGTNRPELLGEAVSNGCIRVANDVIEQLADTVPLGTPVFITP